MRGHRGEIRSLLFDVPEVTPACDPVYFFIHSVICTSVIDLSLEEGGLLAEKELVLLNLTYETRSFFTYKTKYPPVLLLATDWKRGQAQRGKRLFLLCGRSLLFVKSLLWDCLR